MISSIECIILFVYDITRARNIMDLFVSSAHLVKHYTQKNLFTRYHIDNISSLLGNVSLQSGSPRFVDNIKKLLTHWDRAKNSPLLKKITQVLIYTTTFGLYSGPLDSASLGKVRKMQEHFSSNELNYSFDFIYYILDLIQFVCDKSYGIMFNGIDPKTLFVSNMEYDVWLDKAQEHLAKSNFLSNPVAYNIDIHEYLHTLKHLTLTGSEIYKFSCDLDPSIKNIIRKITFELQKVEMRMLSRESAQAMRQVPFCVAIEGDSSVGKSKVAESIHIYFAKLFDKPLTGCERYVKSATSKFWDGFSSDQWSLFMDDVAMWSSNLDLIDESIMDIVRIVNNMPYMPDMAALEDKGKTPFKGELVVITTNSPDLKCNEYFSYPFAAARRVPYHIRVKPKHTDGTFMMKADPRDLEQSQIPDSWYFDILVPVPCRFGDKESGGLKMKQGKLETIHENLGMKELLLFIKEKATIHRNQQNSVVDHSESLRTLDLCESCKLPKNFCSCIQLQSGLVPYAFCLSESFGRYLFVRLLDFLLFYNLAPRFSGWLSRNSHFYVKERLRNLKRKSRDYVYDKFSSIKPNEVVVTMLTVVTVILTSYKLLYSFRKQGINFSMWGNSYEDKNERESVWQKDDYIVDSFDTTPHSMSYKGLPKEKIVEIVSRAVAYLSFDYKGKRRYCRLFNIKGQKFLTPSHCLPEDADLDCTIVRSKLYKHRGDTLSFKLTQSQINRYNHMDLCLITIPGIANGKDMSEFFIKEKSVNHGPITMIKRNKDGCISVSDAPFSKPTTLRNGLLNGIEYQIWKTPDLKTYDGDCGSIMFRIDDMGLRLLGIHESYETTFGLCSSACAIMLTHEFIQTLPLEDEVGIIEPQLGLSDEKVDLLPIPENSCLRTIDSGCIKVYGKIRPINRPRSQVKPTLLCDDMLQRGYSLNYGAPVMSTLKPWKLNISKQVQADNFARWDDLMVIKKDMLRRWLTVDDDFKSEIKILDFKTSINGKPGVRYIDAIPRNTSAGFPYCKSKKYFMLDIPCEEGLHEMTFTDNIMDKVKWRLENYARMNRTYPVYRASLKDEATSLKKISMGKTRVFMGAPVDFTIAMRSLLLSFVRVVQKNKLIFESAPGTEAQCIEWDHLYRYLTEFGDSRMIFGDFSGFDVTMRSDFMRAAFDLIEDFHKECGASEQHCKMIRALSYDVIFPLVEYNGDLIELNGKNPSGQPLTVILNGIINCMYMRYCYMHLNPKKDISSFSDNVKLLTYGDDNGMGVSDRTPWFNHSSIRDELATIGVTYTMADKESESVGYIHVSKADFLKRKWRFESATRTMLCPLNEDSIIKSLMIGLKSKNISVYEHAANIISSAQLEYFWHGKEVFTERTQMLQEMVEKHFLQDYMPRPLQTWDQLLREYNDRSTTFLKVQAGVDKRQCQICKFDKEDSIYSYCPHCKAVDECMLCGEICDSICRTDVPKLWFCMDCYFVFFFEERYNYALLNFYFENACLAYKTTMEVDDLPIEWFHRTPILESALISIWERCIYICVPSTRNGTIGYSLGRLDQ